MDGSVAINKPVALLRFDEESGITLVESMIALLIMLVGLLSIAQVLAFSVVASKTYGRDATKATAYAHDKMEELTGLDFSDTTTNLTTNPPFPSNGVGLTAGGSIAPEAPVEGYVDYLDTAGVRTDATNAAFTRQWQIIDESSNAKRILVSVTSNKSFQYGEAPATVLITQKTF